MDWKAESKNLHELFQLARRSAPCVLFIDELDALGQRRSQLHTSAMRVTVNQLLAELDGVGSDNEGVFDRAPRGARSTDILVSFLA
jgi:AAA+ superfamily predicted ATPase